MPWKSLLASRASFFLFGVTAAGAVSASPAVREGLRKVAREVVKGGIRLGREAQTLADKLREDWQDLLAEARAEVDGGTPPAPPAETKHDHAH